MRKKHALKSLFALMMAVILFVSACGNGSSLDNKKVIKREAAGITNLKN